MKRKPRTLANVIRVWRFQDAPAIYRRLSTNGGDEDWLAVVPDTISPAPGWLDCESFGCCATDHYPIRGGTVYIGCHA